MRARGDEQRSHPRYALSLPGRFMRADKLDHPCRLIDISVESAAMTTPVPLHRRRKAHRLSRAPRRPRRHRRAPFLRQLRHDDQRHPAQARQAGGADPAPRRAKPKFPKARSASFPRVTPASDDAARAPRRHRDRCARCTISPFPAPRSSPRRARRSAPRSSSTSGAPPSSATTSAASRSSSLTSSSRTGATPGALKGDPRR